MCKKLNCWEFIDCGREKNGIMVPLLGECKASTNMKYDGLNDGIGAGRACWAAQDSDCVIKKSNPTFSCYDCSFYKRVLFEEEKELKNSKIKSISA